MQALNESSSIEEVLKYIVACYGAEIYQDKQRLSNLIADLYRGEKKRKGFIVGLYWMILCP